MKKIYKKLFSQREDRRSKRRSIAHAIILSQKDTQIKKLLRMVGPRTQERPSMEVLCLFMQHMMGIEITKAHIRRECRVGYFTAIRMKDELDKVLKVEPKLGYMRRQPIIPDDIEKMYLAD